MGDFNLSTLLFQHSMFATCPTVPVAFLNHSHCIQEDYTQFVEVIRKSLPLFVVERIIMATDYEFDFSEVY